MNLSKLLGLNLKGDDMLEILEMHIEDVVYDFDRTHENIPDVYWAGAKDDGFLLRFNQHQVCDVIFCYILPAEGYSKIDPKIIGVPMYASFEAAEEACAQQNRKYSVARPDMRGQWLRIDDGPFLIHFQFGNGTLDRLTLTAHDAQ